MKIRNLTQDAVLCERAVSADTFCKRAKGLMFQKDWKDFDGLLLDPCPSIHTFFMRMPIDVCFLDDEQKVLKVIGRFKPWKLARGAKGSRSTLELPAGTLERKRIRAGDRLNVEKKGDVF